MLDINEVKDYADYKTMIFKSIPENAVLLVQNKINGRVNVKKSGLSINPPWYRGKLIYTMNLIYNLGECTFKTSDGIYLKTKPLLIINIIDAKKYEIDNINPLDKLDTLSRSILKTFFACNDSNTIINNFNTLEMIDQNKLFKTLAFDTGINVNNIYLGNILLPDNLKSDYQKFIRQKLENKRAEAETLNRTKIAQLQLEIEKLEAEAKAYEESVRLKAITSVLNEYGIFSYELADLIKTYMITNNASAMLFANVGNNIKKDDNILHNEKNNDKANNDELDDIKIKMRTK